MSQTLTQEHELQSVPVTAELPVVEAVADQPTVKLASQEAFNKFMEPSRADMIGRSATDRSFQIAAKYEPMGAESGGGYSPQAENTSDEFKKLEDLNKANEKDALEDLRSYLETQDKRTVISQSAAETVVAAEHSRVA